MKESVVAGIMAVAIIGASVLYAHKNSVVQSEETNEQEEVEMVHLPLLGTEWVWLHTEVRGGDMFSTPTREQFVLTFEKDRLSSSTDCNTFMGGYTLEGNVLLVQQLASTKKACQGSVEGAYSKALMNAESYSITGNRLTIILSKSAGQMVFEQR